MIKRNKRYDFNNTKNILEVEITNMDFNKVDILKALYYGKRLLLPKDRRGGRLLEIFCLRLGAKKNKGCIYLWKPDIQIYISLVRLHGKGEKYIDKKKLYMYMGRPTEYGNPYYAKGEEYRELLCDLHSLTVEHRTDDDDIHKLVDRITKEDLVELHLGCYCYPKRCHTEDVKFEIMKELYRRHMSKDTNSISLLKTDLNLTKNIVSITQVESIPDRTVKNNHDIKI